MIEAYLERTGKLGGSVVFGKKVVPSVGWSAQIADPDGNRVELVQCLPQ